MILHVMAVYDIKARAFLVPFYVGHIDIGRRAFGDVANDPQHQISKNAEDFILYYLGKWNDESAEFTLEQKPSHLGTALNYKKDKVNVQGKDA